MAVNFIATIKENGLGGWCIELKDTLDDRVAVCENISVFEDAIEQMGDDYGGDIEVQWEKDDNVTPVHFEEVKLEISKYQQKFDKDALK
ncbi:MAG: hypothetical protein GXP61_01600 [Epsilonproteobacteria bacterium]|nr:hypothetical protein [Campylobacterota bacterium]